MSTVSPSMVTRLSFCRSSASAMRKLQPSRLAVVAAPIAALTALRERRGKRKDSSESEETGEEDTEEEEDLLEE